MMDHYTPTDFTLTESLAYYLSRARNLIVSEMDAALKQLDITNPQMGVLLLIWSGAATAPVELSRLLGVDPTSVTRLIDKLEDKGLAERRRSEVDRRAVNVALTKEGEAIAAQVPEIAPKVLNTRLRNFTKFEVDELRRLLRKFTVD